MSEYGLLYYQARPLATEAAVHGFVPSPQHHQNIKARVISGLFHVWRYANTGAASWIRAKGGSGPGTPIPVVLPLSALSVLCFCERRLPPGVRHQRGFSASLKFPRRKIEFSLPFKRFA